MGTELAASRDVVSQILYVCAGDRMRFVVKVRKDMVSAAPQSRGRGTEAVGTSGDHGWGGHRLCRGWCQVDFLGGGRTPTGAGKGHVHLGHAEA